MILMHEIHASEQQMETSVYDPHSFLPNLSVREKVLKNSGLSGDLSKLSVLCKKVEKQSLSPKTCPEKFYLTH